MFSKTVCYYQFTADGHGLVFTVRRGDQTIASGVTYDSLAGLKKIAKRAAKRRIKEFVLLD